MAAHALLRGVLVLLACGGLPAAANVVCHYTYGGETNTLTVAPADDPYRVRGVVIGSYFQLRLVLQTRPADLASFKVYVYADRDEGPLLLHQATFAYPPPVPHPGAEFGFSGQHHVYEPIRDGELMYWCEQPRSGKEASK